jgi:NAD(P)H-hydrate repair Nnr-like enzyme with NAD(P)H-hydrate epimerase domain
VLAVLAAGLAGCGTEEIDRGKAERFVKSTLTIPVLNVKCPSGIKAEKGHTFTCTVDSTEGRRYIVTLHVQSDARVSVGPSDVRPVLGD